MRLSGASGLKQWVKSFERGNPLEYSGNILVFRFSLILRVRLFLQCIKIVVNNSIAESYP